NADRDLYQRRRIIAPAGGPGVVVQRGGDDCETLEPHTDMYNSRHDEHHGNTSAEPLEPEHLTSAYVAAYHSPIRPSIVAKRSVDKHEALVRVSSIPCDKEFHRISISHHHTRRQDNLVHIVQVLQGDVVLQVEDLTRYHHQGDNHRK